MIKKILHSPLIISIFLCVTNFVCSTIGNGSLKQDIIQSIVSVEQFNLIIENSEDRLLAFDLFSNWCMPCHILEPILKEIARENDTRITFYKIDTDKFPQLTTAFNITRIPFVVFIKGKKAVYAFPGIQPKETYVKIIKMLTDSSSEQIELYDNNNSEGLNIIHNKYTPFFTPKDITIQ